MRNIKNQFGCHLSDLSKLIKIETTPPVSKTNRKKPQVVGKLLRGESVEVAAGREETIRTRVPCFPSSERSERSARSAKSARSTRSPRALLNRPVPFPQSTWCPRECRVVLGGVGQGAECSNVQCVVRTDQLSSVVGRGRPMRCDAMPCHAMLAVPNMCDTQLPLTLTPFFLHLLLV